MFEGDAPPGVLGKVGGVCRACGRSARKAAAVVHGARRANLDPNYRGHFLDRIVTSLPLLVAALRDSEVQMSTLMKIFLILSMTTIIVITMTTMMVLVLMKTTTMTMRLVNM